MSAWSAHVQVKWNDKAPKWSNWDWTREWNEVKACWSTMGDWDMTFWVNVSNPEDLEKFVHGKLWETDWVANTSSHWVKTIWSK